jgi:hypothetical protein
MLLSTAPFSPPLVEAPLTMMVAVRCATGPLAPAQVSVKAEDVASGPTVSVPAVARTPLQPPEAVQAVALVLVQLRAVLPPAATLAGVAASMTLGCAALGPGPTPPLQPAISARTPANRKCLGMPLEAMLEFVPVLFQLRRRLFPGITEPDSGD